MEFFIVDNNEKIIANLSTDSTGTNTPVLEAVVSEKIDSYDELFLQIPADSEDARLIKEDSTIIFKDIKGWREYSVVYIEDIDGENITMSITAELSSTELMDEIIEDELSGLYLEPEGILGAVLSGTRWSLGYVDSGIYNSRYSEKTQFKNVLEILADISRKYSAEVQFSYQVDGNKIINRFVNLYKQIGEDNGKRFEVDKDVTEIKRTIDTANIKTAIIPYGKEPEETEPIEGEETLPPAERLTIKNVEWKISDGDPVDKPLGQSWIGNPIALSNWGKLNTDGTRRHKFISMEFDLDSEDSIASMAWVQLGRYVNPKITYEVTAIDLYTLTGDEDLRHEYANLGDSVIAIDNYFSNPIVVKNRVIEIKRDLLEPMNNEFVFGDSKNLFSIGAVEDKVEEIADGIWKTNEKVNSVQISVDGKTKTYRGSIEPKGMITGDIWFRPNPLVIGEKQLLVFNGTSWDIQADTADLADADRIKFGTLDGAEINVINLIADNITGGKLKLETGLELTNQGTSILSVNSAGEVVLNVSHLLINEFNPESDSVHADDLSNYLRFDEGIVEIGEYGSEVITQFSNKEWAMLRNGEKKMWLEEDVIKIKKAQLFEQLQIGSFGFVPRANGSLDFKKVGV